MLRLPRFPVRLRAQSLALLCLLASAGVFTQSIRRALLLEPLPAAPAVAAPRQPLVVARGELHPLPQLLSAVDANPFAPDRRRPPARFRLPEERLAATAAAGAAPVEIAPTLELVGTALLPGERSFAMVSANGEPPRRVRVGETLAGFTLRRIEQGRVLFTSPRGERLELHLPKPGS